MRIWITCIAPTGLAFRWTAVMMCQLWLDATGGDG